MDFLNFYIKFIELSSSREKVSFCSSASVSYILGMYIKEKKERKRVTYFKNQAYTISENMQKSVKTLFQFHFFFKKKDSSNILQMHVLESFCFRGNVKKS